MQRHTHSAAEASRQEAGQAPPPPDPRELPPVDAVKRAGQALGELKAYFGYFLAAKLDGIKISLRNAGIFAALGVVGLMAAGGFVVTSVVLVCVGIAQLLAVVFGGRAWAGNLVAGALFLAVLAGGIWVGLKVLSGSMRKGTVQKYELRRRQQRADFGYDVAQRAAQQQQHEA
jgi:hypothetical protein